jgi:hypothetical protein
MGILRRGASRLAARVNRATQPSAVRRSRALALGWPGGEEAVPSTPASAELGRMQRYFEGHSSGAGIWKWRHYFPAFERHLGAFVGKDVNVLEIGVYSGGSLGMWRHYFGDSCRIFGVDVQPECLAYEDERTKIFIGDQADPAFWAEFRSQAPRMDVVIDDGGHLPEQRMTTLEELLPWMEAGGVYICEDVQGVGDRFSMFARTLVDLLNEWRSVPYTGDGADGGLAGEASPFQNAVRSVCFYPFLTVIERTDSSVGIFEAPKHGSDWQPFL